MFFIRRFVFVCLLLAGVSGAQAASILIMGDSLSAAHGIEKSQSWPVLLDKKLKAEGYRYEVNNASISGETSAGGRSRFQGELDRVKPALVLIELGANDGLRGLPISEMRTNLEAMIQAAQKSGAKVLLIGMRMPPNFGKSYTDKFYNTYSELSKTYKTAYVPFLMEGFAGQEDQFLSDGIHPKASAQPRIINNIWPVLKPLLKK